MHYLRLFCFVFILPALVFGAKYDEALKRLEAGNERFVNTQNAGCVNDHNDRRKALMNKQWPFAIILGCSDSRVPPELLFDQGLGDLFIVRVAGNVLGPSEVDSIAYAVNVLECSLIVVLEHENCGAVKAVWQKKASIIPYINAQILPAMDFTNPQCTLDCQIKSNIQHIVTKLKQAPGLAKSFKGDNLKVVGAFYPLSSGKVEFLK